jgi:phosphatidylethanolamine-binding protein
MISGFKASATANADGLYILTSTATTPKAYVGPAPPPETPPYAHRYVELLFEQPANFAVPSSQTRAIQQGIGFDINAFITAASLSAPIAGNYFNVTG